MLRIDSVPALRDKLDFGDCDLVVSVKPEFDIKHGDWPGIYHAAMTCVGASVRHQSGDVASIDAQASRFTRSNIVFQLDLIRVSAESHDFAVHYFSYNDLGNLLGRVAHKLGVKLGFDGLRKPIRHPEKETYLFDDLVISKNWAEALRLLKYDPTRFFNGFDAREEMYEYVMSSPWASPSLYLLENRNYKARTRDAKRPSYSGMLEWLRTDWAGTGFDWDANRERAVKEFEDCYLGLPGVGQAMTEIQSNLATSTAARARFNGARISEMTGLTKQDLGRWMAGVRGRFADDGELFKWVLSVDDKALLEYGNSLYAADQDAEPAGP